LRDLKRYFIFKRRVCSTFHANFHANFRTNFHANFRANFRTNFNRVEDAAHSRGRPEYFWRKNF
jgi:hypothetical protein